MSKAPDCPSGAPRSSQQQRLDRPAGAPTSSYLRERHAVIQAFMPLLKRKAPLVRILELLVLWIVRIIVLTGATAGSERAAQGFMLSMQSTTIYCCVGGLCGAPLHGSWVLVVLKRALYKVLSGARRLTAPGTRTAEGAPICRDGAAAPAAPGPPWIRA